MIKLFKRKIEEQFSTSELREERYFLPKKRIKYDNTNRTIETSLEQVVCSLERIALFKAGDLYVLPKAQTYVSPSESESNIYLKVRTIRLPKSSSYPENKGHEETLTRLIKDYEFNLEPSKDNW